MNIYIFITFSIVDVGGSQLYVRRKISYLKSLGWDVYVYSANQGRILIDDFRIFKDLINPSLGSAPMTYCLRERENIIASMANSIDDNDEIVIESHSNILGLWGEMLAKRLSAVHLLYNIEEHSSCFSESHFEFLKFKWNQRAYASISPLIIKSFFESKGFIINENESYCLLAYGNSPLEDIPSSIILPQADHTICLAGRLDKPFMFPTAKNTAEFLEMHGEKKFNVLVMGGGTTIESQRIKTLFSQLRNCNIIMTGFLYPVPYSLMTQISVLISTAGSCALGTWVGVPTISIDGNDYQPIGVLGETTEQTLFRKGETKVLLPILLEEILEQKKYKKAIIPFKPRNYDYKTHLDFVSNIRSNMGYYDIDGIRIPITKFVIAKLKRFLRTLLGYKLYRWLTKVKVCV